MNKTTTFLLALTLCSVTLTSTFGQTRFSVAPTIAFGYRSMNFAHQTTGSGPASRLTGSGAYQATTVGLMAFYALSKQWSIATGVAYSRVEGTEKFRRYDRKTPVNELRATRDILQLPVFVNYTTSGHRLSPYLSAGAVLSYASTDPVAYYIMSKQTSLADIIALPDSPPRTVRIQAMIGAGVQYRLTPTVAFIVQPTASYERGQPTADYSWYWVYQLGVQTQLKCSF